MLRSALSVIIGWLVYGISVGILFGMTGVNPYGESSAFFKIGSTFYGIVFSFIGGFVTALISKQKQFLHSLALSFLHILIALTAMYFTEGNHWFEWVNIFIIAPFIILGGWIRVRNMK
ncbi:hypothetical protein ACFLU5_08970 [Bacteroidota bacterium]